MLASLGVVAACAAGQRDPTDQVEAVAPRAGLCNPTSRAPGFAPADAAADASHAETLPRHIDTVEIRVVPAEGGAAQRSVHRDGRVAGSHLSGDPRAPMVSVEHGRVSTECVRAVWDAAARVVDATDGAALPPATTDRGTTTLRISRDGADVVEVRWPFRQEPDLAEARSLVALLAEMEIGYW
jgi:hypothetical protein